MFIEAELTKRLGDVGKRLHTARSRNDQVAVDLRLYLSDEIAEISKLTVELAQTLIKMAKEHIETVMPGYTHLQRAQPVTLAHHLMAYVFIYQHFLLVEATQLHLLSPPHFLDYGIPFP